MKEKKEENIIELSTSDDSYFLGFRIYNRLKEVIDKCGTKKRAAEIAGVSTDSLHRYIRGERYPTLDVAAKLASAAGVSLEWLMYGENERSSKAVKEKTASYVTSNNKEINENLFSYVIQGFSGNKDAFSTTKLEDKISDIVKTYNQIQQLPESQHQAVIQLNSLRLDIKHLDMHIEMTRVTAKSTPAAAEVLQIAINDMEGRLESLKEQAANLTSTIQN